MGVFDSVYIDRPDLGINPMTEFQTKDTDGIFGSMWCRTFNITRDGKLILQDVEYELVIPEEERLEVWSPILRPKTTTLRDSNFHGILGLYNCDTRQEWKAKFTDGRLVSLEVAS